MIPLNYHHLYYFQTIATEGSISKAAQKLRLGQPTLSMQLKQFEEHLGQSLFQRKNRTLVLTEMGQLVLEYANQIFQLGQEMLDAVHDRPHQKKLKLQIGASDSVPKTVIKAIMNKAFETKDCVISVREGEGIELLEELTNHRIDVIISNSPAPSLNTEKLLAKCVLKMPLIVAGSPKFQSLSAQFPKSLQGQPFIYPTIHNRLRPEIEEWFTDTKVVPNVVAEVQDTSLVKNLALDGRGMMVMAESAIQDHLDSGQLNKIGTIKGLQEEIWLIAVQRKKPHPIVQELMKNLDLK